MLLFAVILFLLLTLSYTSTVDVQISARGVTATVRGNIGPEGYAFYGVPYAQPPIGDLRFEPAVVLDPSGLIDATKTRAECLQHTNGTIEDCLVINIYTPFNITSSSNFVTYVWIHGGGLLNGGNGLSSGIYHDLINRGPMVIVSIAYRLGPLGFFSTRTSVAPGNMGVSDWIAALQWVQKYIRFFGGNPNKVTIGGQSAGGWSVSALTMTRAADNLWQQSIAESGSIFDSAVMSYDEISRNSSKQLALRLGCVTEEEWNGKQSTVMRQVLACLKGKTGAEIMDADNHVKTGTTWKWGFVQDAKYYPGRLETIALTRRPKPALLGVVHDEEHELIDAHAASGQLQYYTENYTISFISQRHDFAFWNNSQAVLNGALQQYVYDNNWDMADHANWASALVKFYSEIRFIGPTRRDANYLYKTGSKVYLYSFDFLTPLAQPNITDARLRGVPHGWELQYVMGIPRFHTANDNSTRELMSNLWTNFILSGNPTPVSGGLQTGFTWPEIGTNNAFVSLGPKPTIGQNFHPSSNFWACTAPQLDGHPNPYC